MSEERDLLRDTVAALVEKHASPEAVRKAAASEKGYDEALWKMLCEQVGAAALIVPEELGGAGGELADAAVVVEELGKGLVPTPLLGTTLAELALLSVSEPDEDLLGGLAEGTSIGDCRLRPRLRPERQHRRRRDRRRRRHADPLDLVHRDPGCVAMDITRPLAAVEAAETAPLGADPGLADIAAILLAVEQIGAAIELPGSHRPVHEGPRAVRQAHRQLSGAQAPDGRSVRRCAVCQGRRRRSGDRPVADVGVAGTPGRQRGVLERWRPRPYRCTAASPSPGRATSSCTSSGRTAARSFSGRRGSSCAGSNPRCSSLAR